MNKETIAIALKEYDGDAEGFFNWMGGYLAAQYEENGWIQWNGGECPVKSSEETSVRFRSGGEETDIFPEEWVWEHNGSLSDIIAYRIVS